MLNAIGRMMRSLAYVAVAGALVYLYDRAYAAPANPLLYIEHTRQLNTVRLPDGSLHTIEVEQSRPAIKHYM